MPVKPLGKRSPLKMRFGAQVPMALGMHRRGSAAMIPDAAFYHLENGVFVGPNVRNRPGQQRATNAVTGPIEGMCDTSDIGAAKAATDGLGALPAAYASLSTAPAGDPAATTLYDFNEPTATTANVVIETEAGRQSVIRKIGSTLYIGTRETTSPVVAAKIKSCPTNGRPSALVTSVSAGEVGRFFADFILYSGTVYVAYGITPGTGSLGTSRVYTLAGSVLTSDDDTGRTRGFPLLATYGSDLYAIHTPIQRGSATDMLIRKKSGGVWSTATLTAVAGFEPTDAVEFMGKLYIGGILYTVPAGAFSQWMILSWDGATLATARSLGGTDASPMCLAASATKLYFSWRSGSDAIIGSFDNTTWVNNVVSHTTMTGVASYPINGLFLEQGKLCMLGSTTLFYQDEASIASGPWNSVDSPSGYNLAGFSTTRGNTYAVGAH